MILTTYGRSSGFCIDPIEKKPLNHFFPGTSIFSFGTAGCNLGCKFCQNWDISKSKEFERLSEEATPERIAQTAKKLDCRSVAFTYNDPVIFAEYAMDTADACRALGIYAVAKTAGYITDEARPEFFKHMDAANVDLKAFTEKFYRNLTLSGLRPVLDTLTFLKEKTKVWLEITNLIIPGENDSPEEFLEMCKWIVKNLGADVPVHFTAFHPDFKMNDHPATSASTLRKAREIALAQGIHFVYTGNVSDVKTQSTYCHGCGKLLIERNWYELGAYHIKGGKCRYCQTVCPGYFEDSAGRWGSKRVPVSMN